MESADRFASMIEKGGSIMLECKTYTLDELKKVLNISKRQWDERKEELLEYFKMFFVYEITMKGRSYNFHIKEIITEYEPLPRKTKMEEIVKFYEQEVDHILQYKPRNTGSNLAREIVAKNNKQNHKEGTAANYIRPYLKANYTVSDREWCVIDYDTFTYEPIPADALAELKKLFNIYLSSEVVADAIADAEAGYSTKEEAYNKLKGNYNDALTAFKDKYGYRPYKAGELKKNAWIKE